MTRVALVVGRDAPQHDGVADYVHRLADALPGVGVEPVVVEFPKVSCRWMVTDPRAAVPDTVPSSGAEMSTSFEAAPAVTVAVWVAGVRPPLLAVSVGVPALVSP